MLKFRFFCSDSLKEDIFSALGDGDVFVISTLFSSFPFKNKKKTTVFFFFNWGGKVYIIFVLYIIRRMFCSFSLFRGRGVFGIFYMIYFLIQE